MDGANALVKEMVFSLGVGHNGRKFVTTQPLGVVFGKRIFTTYRGAQLVPAGSLLAETQDMGDVRDLCPTGCCDQPE